MVAVAGAALVVGRPVAEELVDGIDLCHSERGAGGAGRGIAVVGRRSAQHQERKGTRIWRIRLMLRIDLDRHSTHPPDPNHPPDPRSFFVLDAGQ